MELLTFPHKPTLLLFPGSVKHQHQTSAQAGNSKVHPSPAFPAPHQACGFQGLSHVPLNNILIYGFSIYPLTLPESTILLYNNHPQIVAYKKVIYCFPCVLGQLI